MPRPWITIVQGSVLRSTLSTKWKKMPCLMTRSLMYSRLDYALQVQTMLNTALRTSSRTDIFLPAKAPSKFETKYFSPKNWAMWWVPQQKRLLRIQKVSFQYTGSIEVMPYSRILSSPSFANTSACWSSENIKFPMILKDCIFSESSSAV